jgi:hypothetical protein
MKIYDIDTIFRDTKQDNLYNLFTPTFKFRVDIPFKNHIAEEGEFMRIDSVCKKIYDSLDELDVLLSINDIDNPLNIMIGDNFLFPPLSAIEDFRLKTQVEEENVRLLTNPNKSTKKDTSRQAYVEQNFSLPPTVASEPTSQVRIENNQLIIGRD